MQPIHKQTNKLINNHTIVQPNDRLTNRQANQQTYQPTNQSTDQPTIQQINQPTLTLTFSLTLPLTNQLTNNEPPTTNQQTTYLVKVMNDFKSKQKHAGKFYQFVVPIFAPRLGH